MKGQRKSINEPSKRTGERTLTSIGERKKGKRLVRFGKEELLLDDDAFTERPLYVGLILSKTDFNALAHLSGLSSLYSYGLGLVKRGLYSEHELRNKLKAKCQEGDFSYREVIFRLKQEGFVDDFEYAREYSEEKLRAGYGPNRIKNDLREKKRIPLEIISKLEFPFGQEALLALGGQLNRRYSRFPKAKKLEKARNALIIKGYGEKNIKVALGAITGDGESEASSLIKEYEIGLKKYQARYNGYELKAHLYRYLTQKGFESDKVRLFLEDKHEENQ